ncbi:MAG: N-acetyltransferase family protein [Chloroflexi bacterium]|nr:N-acetyltransferase family protein [Chloroflexota bacterium]
MAGEPVISIRTAVPSDASSIAAIYGPYVAGTTVSFEVESPTAEEMAERIRGTTATYPWLVAENEKQVVGFVYAGPNRARAAYRWSVDVSVYVRPAAQRQGIGWRLYQALFEILREQGIVNAYAGVTLPNAASVGLHEAMGFKPVGVFRNVGYKLGSWHDVGWWQLELQPPLGSPAEPIPFPLVTLTGGL